MRLTNTHAHTGARTPIHSCTQCSTRDTASLFRVCVRVRVCDSVGGGVAVVVIVAATNRMKRTRFGVSPIRCGGFFVFSNSFVQILYMLNKQDQEKKRREKTQTTRFFLNYCHSIL